MKQSKKKVSTSALFFALHSTNYPQSNYCRQELRWFCQHNGKNQRSLKIGNELRIFNILLKNISHETWPEALGGTSGFPMHDVTKGQSLGEFTSPTNQNYEKQLRKIVDAVEKTIEAFPSEKNRPETLDREDKHAVHVFFADVADSQKLHRKRLISDARTAGAIPLDSVPPPWESKTHTQAMDALLKKADLSVHLLDQWAGREIQDKPGITYANRQLELVQKNNKLAPLIWVPKNLDLKTIEDESQATLLVDLETGERKTKNHEFIRGAENAFSEIFRQKITEIQRNTAHGDMTQSFLIDTHQKDQRYAYSLASYLAEQNMEVDFNKESHDPIASLGNFESSVRHVKHLIVLFGRVAPTWLRGRIKKAVKISAEQFEADEQVLENIWVYLMPGGKGNHEIPKVPLFDIKVLDNTHKEDIDPTIADHLIHAKLNRGAV